MDTRKVPEEMISSYEAPFAGFRFFLSKPKLWLIPLLGTLLAWICLVAIMLIVTYKAWPTKGSSETLYLFKIFQAVGAGAMVSLLAWIFVFPIILNLFFEHLIKHVLIAKGDVIPSTGFFQTAWSGVYILLKTWHWRLLWVVLGLIVIWVCAPLALILFQLGIIHAAMIDGCDLTLGLQGVTPQKKWELIKKHRIGLLVAAIIGGIVSCFLMPTVLVWLFWIPGIYVGAALWVRTWVA